MENKERLLELEKELKFHIGNLFVEKFICDDEAVVASYIDAIKNLLEEVRNLKIIE